jgi:hypothetical protein
MSYSDRQAFSSPVFGTNESHEPRKYISMLTNAIYFFIQRALIIIGDQDYRLIVFGKDKDILVDKRYATARGARIAFMKRFGYKYFEGKPRAEWSFAYPPDTDWLEGIETSIASFPSNSRKKTVHKKR